MVDSSKIPLLVTQDPDLRVHVERLASTSCSAIEYSDNPYRVHAQWSSYPYIIVGADLAHECCQARLPRRSHVALVHLDTATVVDPSSWERSLWQSAVTLGAENVIGLPSGDSWLREALDSAQGSSSLGKLIAVMPGSGGSGASTFAVNLGLRAVHEGHSAALVDADRLGGGIDLTLGTEEVSGTRWHDIDPGTGRIAAHTLASALPTFQGLSFLSFGRSGAKAPEREVLAAVVDAARRAFDLVVVDVAREMSPETELITSGADCTVIAVRNHVRPVAASARVREFVRSVGGKPTFILSADNKGVGAADVAQALGESQLLEVPFIPSMSTRADEGEFPTMTAAYATTCDRILTLVVGAVAQKAA